MNLLDQLDDAARHPSEVTFIPERQAATSFGQIWKDSETAAAWWSRYPRGTALGGLITSSPRMIASMLGALRAGLRFVSLPLPSRAQDPQSYREQIETIARLADLQGLVVDDDYLAMLPLLPFEAMPVSRCQSTQLSAARLEEAGELVQFSSGTTASPKGVVLSLDAVGAAVLAQIDALAVGPGDMGCFWLPLSHDFGLVGGLFSSWAGASARWLGSAKGRFVCIDPATFIAQPWTWFQACAQFGATITGGPPFAYALATRFFERSIRDAHDLRRLRACIVGAEPIDPELLHAFSERASRYGLDEHALCPAYGLAEATLAVTMHRPGIPWRCESLDHEGAAQQLVCVGQTVLGMKIKTDAGSGPGEIHVQGPSLMTTYLGREPQWDAEGWLATGDVGIIRDEGLYVIGRRDSLLFVAGRTTSDSELEAAALRHPSVRPGNCAVCSDGQGRYLLAVELRKGIDPGPHVSELPRRLRAMLARAVGVGPSAVLVLPSGSLPKTSSGKLQRHIVRARWEALSERALATL